MKFKRNLAKQVLILVSIFSIPLIFLGAIMMNINGELNADGSGSLTFTYSAKTSEITKNNNQIGNLPFTPQTVKEYFSSQNIEVIRPSVYKNKKDSTFTTVSVKIDFKNINTLNQLKAFSGMKLIYNKIDDKSKLFRWNISPEVAGKLEELTCVINFECESLSSSAGNVKDKSITFYKNAKNSDFSKEVVLGATVITDGVSKNSTNKIEVKKNDEEKSCGLFGIELPILILAGYFFSNYKKSNKNSINF